MTPDDMTNLRAEFPAAMVGLLPKVTKKDGEKSKCKDCGGYLPPHIHLDYVGHGAVTDRLLAVDPAWNWEPLAWDNDLPKFDLSDKGDPIGLWIKLTVAGVTRLGYGSVGAGSFDAEKQLIGDALRNAAMRFGVALDLWIKGHAEDDERNSDDRVRPNRQGRTAPPEIASPEQRAALAERLAALPDDAATKIMDWLHTAGVETLDALPVSYVERLSGIIDRAQAKLTGGASTEAGNPEGVEGAPSSPEDTPASAPVDVEGGGVAERPDPDPSGTSPAPHVANTVKEAKEALGGVLTERAKRMAEKTGENTPRPRERKDIA